MSRKYTRVRRTSRRRASRRTSRRTSRRASRRASRRTTRRRRNNRRYKLIGGSDDIAMIRGKQCNVTVTVTAYKPLEPGFKTTLESLVKSEDIILLKPELFDENAVYYFININDGRKINVCIVDRYSSLRYRYRPTRFLSNEDIRINIEKKFPPKTTVMFVESNTNVNKRARQLEEFFRYLFCQYLEHGKYVMPNTFEYAEGSDVTQSRYDADNVDPQDDRQRTTDESGNHVKFTT